MKRMYAIMFLAAVMATGTYQSKAQVISMKLSDPAFASASSTVTCSLDDQYGIVSTYEDSDGVAQLDFLDIGAGIIRRYAVPTDLKIVDLYYDSTTQYLYFCGSATSQSSGLGVGYIGCIHAPSFQSGSIVFNWIEVKDVPLVYRIAGYRDGRKRHVTALGNTIYNSTPVCCVLEFPKIAANPTYYTHILQKSEFVDDVLITDNYLAVTGFDTNSAVMSIAYRRRPLLSYPDPEFENEHFYTWSDTVLTGTTATPLRDDYLCVSYRHYLPSLQQYYTRIRTIDLATGLNDYSQQYGIGADDIGMAARYVSHDDSVVMNQRDVQSSYYVHINPYNTATSYSTVREYRPLDWFEGFSVYGNKYYVGGFGASWFIKEYNAVPTNNPDIGCPMRRAISSGTISKMMPAAVPQPPVRIQSQGVSYSSQATETTVYYTIDCFNQ